MNFNELVGFLELNGVGEYHVSVLPDGVCVVAPLVSGEILVTTEAHKQNIEFFRKHDD